jgi:hypothetical protein
VEICIGLEINGYLPATGPQASGLLLAKPE